MDDKGWDVTPVEMRSDGLTYTFSVQGGTPGDTSAMDDRLDCEGQFNLPDAEVAYQAQHALSGAEREAVFREFAGCMENAGVPGITVRDTVQHVAELVVGLGEAGEDNSAAVACLDQYGSRLYGPDR